MTPGLRYSIFYRLIRDRGNESMNEAHVELDKFIEVEEARRDCYRLLSACFYEPQKRLFLEENVFASLTSLLKRVCPDAAEFSERMEKASLRYGNEELLVEYARLFVGPNELLAPPYASVYLEEGRSVMGESTTKVLEVYRAEGLSLDEHFKDLPDHISAELEFMYFLLHNEVEAFEENDTEKAGYFLNKQEYFSKTFLDRWVAPFCEKIKLGTENEFYKALADCLSVFIAKTGRSDILPEELKESLART